MCFTYFLHLYFVAKINDDDDEDDDDDDDEDDDVE